MSRIGEEDRSNELEVRDWIPAVVIDKVAVRVADVVDLAGARVIFAAALRHLVAVAPLVIARRVYEGAVERGPQVENREIVLRRAVLLARMDVADVHDEVDLRVGVDRVDEGRRRLKLSRVARRRSVRCVSVSGDDECVCRLGVEGPFHVAALCSCHQRHDTEHHRNHDLSHQ